MPKIHQLIRPVIFSLLALFVLAGCSSKTPPERAEDYLFFFNSFVVNLSDEQQSQLDAIVESWFDDYQNLIPLNQSLYQLTKESIVNGNFDEQEINRLIDEQSAMRKKMANNQFQAFKQLLSSLNEEQKRDILDAIEEFKDKSMSLKYALGEAS